MSNSVEPVIMYDARIEQAKRMIRTATIEDMQSLGSEGRETPISAQYYTKPYSS